MKHIKYSDDKKKLNEIIKNEQRFRKVESFMVKYNKSAEETEELMKIYWK